MVEIPDHLMAERVITEAREYCKTEDINVPGEIGLGQHGQHEKELDWSLADMNPENCEVDMMDETVVVMGEIEAEYSVQVSKARRNPPGKAHPAEYERKRVPLYVSIELDLDGLNTPHVRGEIA